MLVSIYFYLVLLVSRANEDNSSYIVESKYNRNS